MAQARIPRDGTEEEKFIEECAIAGYDSTDQRFKALQVNDDGDLKIALDDVSIEGDVDVHAFENAAGKEQNALVDGDNKIILSEDGSTQVIQDTAANLKAEVEIAANQDVNVKADYEDLYGIVRIDEPEEAFHITQNYSTAQTDESLVSAPIDGKKIYITDIKFSTDTEGSYKLVENTVDSSDVWGLTYLAARGGENTNLRTPIILDPEQDLGITSTIDGNHTINISGFIK